MVIADEASRGSIKLLLAVLLTILLKIVSSVGVYSC